MRKHRGLACASRTILVLACVSSAAAVQPASDGPELVLQTGHGQMVEKLAFNQSGNVLLTQGGGSVLKLWDLKAHTMVREISTLGSSPAYALSASGDHLLMGDSLFGKSMDEVSVATGKHGNGFGTELVKGQKPSPLSAVGESADGRWHAFGNLDGLILAFGPENATLIQRSGIYAEQMWFSHDGNQLLIRRQDGSLILRDLSKGKSGTWPDFKMSDTAQAAFTPDGRVVVLNPKHGGFDFLDLSNTKVTEHQCNCPILMLSGNGTRIGWLEVEDDYAKRLRVVSAAGFETVSVLPTPRTPYRTVSNWEGTAFAFGGIDGSVSMVAEGDAAVRQLAETVRMPTSLRWIGSDRLRMMDDQHGIVEWLTEQGESNNLAGPSPGSSRGLSEDGSVMVTTGRDNELLMYRIGAPNLERTGIKIPDEETYGLTVDDAGDAIAFTQGKMNTADFSKSDFRQYVARRSNGAWKIEAGCRSPDIPLAAFLGSRLISARCTEVVHDRRNPVITVTATQGVVIEGGSGFVNLVSEKETTRLKTDVGISMSAGISPDGRYMVVVGNFEGMGIEIFDLTTGRSAAHWSAPIRYSGAAFNSPDNGPRIAISNEGTVYFLDGSGAMQVCTFQGALIARIVLNGSSWLVTDKEGRFDTGDIEGLDTTVRWRLKDNPGQVLPLEIFMRQYYTPRLFSRMLAGDKLADLPALSSLNRAQPRVEITHAEVQSDHPDRATVRVRVSRQRVDTPAGPKDSGAQDLRLFRDGRMVAFQPGDLEDKEYVFDAIPLPRGTDRSSVEFTAYAFNSDLVKSATARTSVAVHADPRPTERKAFVINIGVNFNQARGCSLAYAAADAEALGATLAASLAPLKIEAQLLVSRDAAHDGATKEAIRTAIERVVKGATPDDVFVLTYSGHGYSAPDGKFYLLPSDLKSSCGGVEANADWLASAISSDELTDWLRDLYAGETVMILDACYSAASVESGDFKPGPMGSKGLGQLAYDKRIRILTASQSTQAAAENGWLGMGLLSYALTKDGLLAKEADWQPKDGSIWLREWLTYAVKRVPELYQALKKGDTAEFRNASRGVRLEERKRDYQHPALQKPVLFDFVTLDKQGLKLQ